MDFACAVAYVVEGNFNVAAMSTKGNNDADGRILVLTTFRPFFLWILPLVIRVIRRHNAFWHAYISHVRLGLHCNTISLCLSRTWLACKQDSACECLYRVRFAHGCQYSPLA